MLKTFIARFRRDEKGASLVEYAVALLVVVAVGTAAMGKLGGVTQEQVTDTCGIIKTTNIAAACS